jgi:hypothetical protein
VSAALAVEVLERGPDGEGGAQDVRITIAFQNSTDSSRKPPSRRTRIGKEGVEAAEAVERPSHQRLLVLPAPDVANAGERLPIAPELVAQRLESVL